MDTEPEQFSQDRRQGHSRLYVKEGKIVSEKEELDILRSRFNSQADTVANWLAFMLRGCPEGHSLGAREALADFRKVQAALKEARHETSSL